MYKTLSKFTVISLIASQICLANDSKTTTLDEIKVSANKIEEYPRCSTKYKCC